MSKRTAPARGSDDRRRKARNARGDQRRSADAPTRRGRIREPGPTRSAPQTNPIPRPVEKPARPKSASQAKARAKARKAKAPKVVRPPLRDRLRERIVVKLTSIELSPRALVARVPFVVLVIGSLGMGLGITLWLSTDSAERSYQLGNARETNQALLQQKEALERDVLEAQAAPALAEAARDLGMIPSRDTAHLVQDPAGNWIVVGTPKPAEGVPPPPLNTPLPEAAPPPPPPPPAPRVIEPRELVVRLPSRTPPAPLPGAERPMPTVPGVPTVPTVPTVPGAPGAPVAPLAGAPAPEVPQLVPGAPPEAGTPHVPALSGLPGPAPAVEQVSPPAPTPLGAPA
ncbi:hypothetical protein [Mycolicibacterium sp. XJ1819]